jgi:hypothetical protein
MIYSRVSYALISSLRPALQRSHFIGIYNKCNSIRPVSLGLFTIEFESTQSPNNALAFDAYPHAAHRWQLSIQSSHDPEMGKAQERYKLTIRQGSAPSHSPHENPMRPSRSYSSVRAREQQPMCDVPRCCRSRSSKSRSSASSRKAVHCG